MRNVWLWVAIVACLALWWYESANSDDGSDDDSTDSTTDANGDVTTTAANGDTGQMTLSDNGLATLQGLESVKLTAYPDAGGYSIGYGHFGATPGETEDQAQADSDLASDVSWAEDAVNKYVKVPLNQDQFDALVIFVYNAGAPAFAASTLLKNLNAGDFDAAVQQFGVWIKSKVNGVLQVNPSLVKRQSIVAALFGGGS